MNDFRLLMLSAMYENGGNTTHRLLDGHPQLFVYPFESQLGTHLVQDHLTSMFPVKYRWPVFTLDATPEEDYRAMIDEECKVRARTPHVSKFRHVPFDFSDDERAHRFVTHVRRMGRSRAANVAAFFGASFEAWTNHARSGAECVYVGYSPIIAVDADKILGDFPGAHIVHVVRNPWSAYADTTRRPLPLALERYVTAWTTTQFHALVFQKLWPARVHIVRYEDIVADPRGALGRICERIGVSSSDTLATPTWNGTPLDQVYPWGTIRIPTPEANRATAEELSLEDRARVRAWAHPYLQRFDYQDFI